VVQLARDRQFASTGMCAVGNDRAGVWRRALSSLQLEAAVCNRSIYLALRTDTGAEGTTVGRKQNRTSKDKEVNKAARDSDDALVCCIENTVEDRIMVSGASFHASYCTKKLERLEQHHCLREDYSQFNYVSSGYLVSKVS
ncbi:hypothetical protein Tco_0691173, partial [Tanacetum coccineum]